MYIYGFLFFTFLFTKKNIQNTKIDCLNKEKSFIPETNLFFRVKNENFRYIRENNLYSKYIPNQKYTNFVDKNYNITTEFFVPNSIENAQFQKVRISHFMGSPTTELLSILWFPKSYNYPILSIDLVQFAPNIIICHIYFYFFAANEYIQKKIEIEKKIWEKPISPSAHLVKFLMSLTNSLPKNMKNIDTSSNSLFFSIKEPQQIIHVYYAIKSILNTYITHTPPIDSSCFSTPSIEFNHMRTNLEQNFIYKKYMKSYEIKELMDLFSITP